MAMTPEQAIAAANARLRLSQANAAPEQGNMYTQSAEDIQYDPMSGVPLNTSSYGSETKGGTDYARKALTTAAALPINLATGVAKNVGGATQTLNRYFGGQSTKGNLSKPEEFLNALNQIESGTQQQSGSPNLLKGASMVGQAAPWFATGNIGGIPSFVNAAKNVGAGMAMGGASALANPEQVGMSTDEYRNAKNKDIAIQSALGGAFPAVGEMVKALRGAKLTPQMEAAVTNARESGYTLPPTQAGGGIFTKTLESLAGKEPVAQAASIKNQEITNKLAAKSLGLDKDTPLTPEILSGIRDEAGKAYEALKTLPKKAEVIADSSMNRAGVAEINPAKMVEDLKVARREAEGYYNAYGRSAHPEDLAKAKEFKAEATRLENTLESYAKDMGKADLVPALRDARQLIAKTYTVEKAMNQTTGSVDAGKLAARLKQGKPMSDELKEVAQFAQAFPKAVKTPESLGGFVSNRKADLALATGTGIASLIGGQDKYTTGGLTLASLLARPGARKLILSKHVQNSLVQQAEKATGDIRQALPSPEETRQLAKMLLMQRLGSTSENQ